MLNHLYKKLHIMFTISLMLIITLIIGILSVNYIKEQSVNDSTLFQRMATFMIYQLEDSDQNIETVIRSYEDKYSIFCFAKDTNGTVIYKSNLNFPTDTKTLMEIFNSQISKQLTLVTDDSSVSEQDGTIEITGTSNEKYWGISAKVISKDDKTYYFI